MLTPIELLSPRAPRACVLAAAVLAVLSGALPTQAQVSGSETTANFGTLGQNSVTQTDPVSTTTSLGPQACVPTSTIDGLTFLENTYGNSYFPTDPNNINEVNKLASVPYMNTRNNPPRGPFGTTYANMVNGLQSYINNTQDKVAILGGQFATGWGPAGAANNINNVTPTASFLTGALNANDATEIWLQWGTYLNGNFTVARGAHSLDLISLSLSSTTVPAANANPNTFPTGTITMMDPNGNGGAVAMTSESGTVTLEPDGYLYVTYDVANEAAPPADDNTSSTTDGEAGAAGVPLNGRIALDLIENVTPDGGMTSAMLGAAIVTLAAFRRRLVAAG